MSIDGFTFGAQLLNFVVLVWLLKRFLYRPILGAITARENKNRRRAGKRRRQQRPRPEEERNKFERNNSELRGTARRAS